MSTELRALRDDPYAILERIEERLQAARLDAGGGQAQSWTGLGFRLGANWFVAPREDVREVIAPPRTTRVPNAQPWLCGLANVRGELLAIVDLPRFFGAGRSRRDCPVRCDRLRRVGRGAIYDVRVSRAIQVGVPRRAGYDHVVIIGRRPRIGR